MLTYVIIIKSLLCEQSIYKLFSWYVELIVKSFKNSNYCEKLVNIFFKILDNLLALCLLIIDTYYKLSLKQKVQCSTNGAGLLDVAWVLGGGRILWPLFDYVENADNFQWARCFLQVKVLKIEENDKNRSLQCLQLKSYCCCYHLECFFEESQDKK